MFFSLDIIEHLYLKIPPIPGRAVKLVNGIYIGGHFRKSAVALWVMCAHWCVPKGQFVEKKKRVRSDQLVACVSWVNHNAIRAGFQHIESNINRGFQTCHHIKSLSGWWALTNLSHTTIRSHEIFDIKMKKLDISFLIRFNTNLRAERISLPCHLGGAVLQIFPCNCRKSCNTTTVWNDEKCGARSSSMRGSLPWSAMQGNSTYTVTGLLHLGTGVLSCRNIY